MVGPGYVGMASYKKLQGDLVTGFLWLSLVLGLRGRWTSVIDKFCTKTFSKGTFGHTQICCLPS